MARQATGSVVVRESTRGATFALRFTAYGKRRFVTLGSRDEGWTRDRAEAELRHVLADVERGKWRPTSAVEPPPESASFHEYASQWLAERAGEGLRPATVAEYRWCLTHHLLPFFRDYALESIRAADVDAYRRHKIGEREAAPVDAPHGERGLSNNSINKTIKRLSQILGDAVEAGLIESNPAAGRKRRAKGTRPSRPYLDTAAHFAALLECAHNAKARAVLATLMFAGLRVGELCELRRSDLDLAGCRITVGRAKTDAGVRTVDVLPVLRDELTAYVASCDLDADDYLFGTRNGGPINPSGIRNRMLAPALRRAREIVVEAGLPDFPPSLTPHALRRSYASLMFAVGESPPYVMAQLGHTDPGFTLAVYAKAMRRGGDEPDRLKALVEGAEMAFIGTDTESETSSGAVAETDDLSQSQVQPGIQETRPAGFEPAASCSGVRRDEPPPDDESRTDKGETGDRRRSR